MPQFLGRLKIVLAVALLPAILFLSFPPSIIEANGQEIAFNRRALYVVWLLFLASTAILSIVALVGRERSKRILVVVLAALTANILLWNAAFPHFWLSSISAMWIAVAVEVAVFTASLWVVTKLPFRLMVTASAMLAVLTLAFSIPEHLELVRTLPGKHDQPTSPHRADILPPPQSDRFTGNVYHIVLDAFARPYLTYRINKGDVDLSGYTYYPNAIANYGRTNLSMRSVFTGEYHPDHIADWESAFQAGFTNRLAENHVEMDFFPFYPSFCHQKASICRGTTSLYGFYRKQIGITLVVDIIFQSMLPVSLRDYLLASLEHDDRPEETWDYGFSLTSWFGNLYDYSEVYPKWRQPIQSLTMDTVDDFIQTEEGLSPTGRYVYLHVMVPHDPYNFDPNCSFVVPSEQATKRGSQAREDQFSCAVTVIKKITERLKELGRFDNSLVIIHADHGGGFYEQLHRWDPSFALTPNAPHLNRNKDDLSLMPSEWIKGVAEPLLLIHRPGQIKFDTTQQEAQLIDVAPTIMDFFHLDHTAYPGVSLISSEPLLDREAVYFESSTNTLKDLKKLAEFVRVDGKWQFKAWRQVE